jgi:thiamine-monophosphate kinase
MAVEGIHFKREWSSAFDIGRRIAAATIADVLAMGGRCDYLVAAVALTGGEELSWIESLAQGMKSEADRAGAHIVGGDISRGPAITLALTALGHCDNPITRSGAQIGDGIYLSSMTGWSAAGLHLLRNEISINSEIAEKALSEFSSPTIDYDVDFSAAHALCDVSDSIFIQGAQMADASSVAFTLDLELFAQNQEFQKLQSLAQSLSIDVLDWVLGGGEDHALLATGVDLPGIRIGTVTAGSGIRGVEMKKAPVSWSHFQ